MCGGRPQGAGSASTKNPLRAKNEPTRLSKQGCLPRSLRRCADLQPRTAIGDDLALAVVQPLGAELQLARLQTTRAVAATGVAVVHAGGREGQQLAGRDRAVGVVQVPAQGQVEVAPGLHATTGIGQARRLQRQVRSAGKRSTGTVVDAGQQQA